MVREMARRWTVWKCPTEYASRCVFCWARQFLKFDDVGREPYAECPNCGEIELFDPDPLRGGV